MAEIETRLDRIDQNIQTLASVTGAMAREVQSLVQGLATDRAAFHKPLRDLSGFVTTASLALERVESQVQRLAEATEAGFAHMRTLLAETSH